MLRKRTNLTQKIADTQTAIKAVLAGPNGDRLMGLLDSVTIRKARRELLRPAPNGQDRIIAQHSAGPVSRLI